MAECGKHAADGGKQKEKQSLKIILALLSSGVRAECDKHAADGGKQKEKQSLKLALALSSGQSLEKMLLMEASRKRNRV